MDGRGGVLRYEDGAFLGAFATNFWFCIVPQAELWEILHGMKLAWGKGITELWVESHSMIAIRLL